MIGLDSSAIIDLFKGDPLVIKLEEGKYVIDIPSTFHSEMKKKKEF